jgi:hypothetical protein
MILIVHQDSTNLPIKISSHVDEISLTTVVKATAYDGFDVFRFSWELFVQVAGTACNKFFNHKE